MTDNRKPGTLGDLFAQFAGVKIPGGCDHCDAYQTVRNDPEHPKIHHIDIHHDDTCPFWLAYQARHGEEN